MEHEVNSYCLEKFRALDDRLKNGDTNFRDHDERLVGVEHDVTYLTRSLNGVTRALWGVAGAIGMAALGLIVYFLQTK